MTTSAFALNNLPELAHVYIRKGANMVPDNFTGKKICASDLVSTLMTKLNRPARTLLS